MAGIVLVYLGVAMWLTVPFLRVRGWVVALVAGLLTMIVPPLNWLVRQQPQQASSPSMGQGAADPERGTMSLFDVAAHPVEAVRDILLTGAYPVGTWLVYLLVGMLIGRALLSAVAAGQGKRFATILASGGAVLATLSTAVSWCVYHGFARTQQLQALGFESVCVPGLTIDDIVLGSQSGGPSGPWSSLLLDAPHSGTVLDIARGVGIAGTVLGLCLLACWALPRTPWALRPVLAAGAAPLTVYCLHILLNAALEGRWKRSSAAARQRPLAWRDASPPSLSGHSALSRAPPRAGVAPTTPG
ncbi:hypothetical protein O159_13400 [Leifsonia xyli subsp. cynodontis DSM 46306]|uniref:Heparan-alpha-glucosaminide N-acetyltransferase catalytic domain-containing protein n=1 Tax=Leifsonia xyli subsp. cynodontis DSM 46306 TaxID=1389489 RepID=U3P936_LEIXC|nr:hypothetical protein [Leifsonia xyli]AGW41412.1 hypothetical protein O159_13400 [Leifsonia xyli subsp. cynodontis DSM 46306]